MTGDWAVDVPTYNAGLAALEKQWPQLSEELKICMLIPQFGGNNVPPFATIN